jgi:hypothetical protein
VADLTISGDCLGDDRGLKSDVSGRGDRLRWRGVADSGPSSSSLESAKSRRLSSGRVRSLSRGVDSPSPVGVS